MSNQYNDHTPPTTGVLKSGENENSRKNTMNHKQKQSKQKSKKGQPYADDSNSSGQKDKAPGKPNMSSLNDLPGFGKQNNNENDYDFGGFDDFDESGGSDSQKKPNNKFSNAERFLDDFENE